MESKQFPVTVVNLEDSSTTDQQSVPISCLEFANSQRDQYAERCDELEAEVQRLREETRRLVVPRREGSVDQRKEELSFWYLAWLIKHGVVLAAEHMQDILWDLEFESECRGWQSAHDKRPCGHPRAFYQDANWPASEKSYNPETYTSDPPISYNCMLCAMTTEVAALKEQLRLAQPTSLQWQDLLSERDALKEQVRKLTQPVSDELIHEFYSGECEAGVSFDFLRRFQAFVAARAK